MLAMAHCSKIIILVSGMIIILVSGLSKGGKLLLLSIQETEWTKNKLIMMMMMMMMIMVMMIMVMIMVMVMVMMTTIVWHHVSRYLSIHQFLLSRTIR